MGGLALAVQAGILGLALVVGVLDPPVRQETKLRVADGSVAANRAQQQAAKRDAARLDRLQASGMEQLARPMMEALQPSMGIQAPAVGPTLQGMGSMLPIGSLASGSLSALSGIGATGNLPSAQPVEFLGESLNASRIVLLLDVSGSVKTKMERAGVSMERLREEVYRFVEQLGPNHLFGIIQFTRSWEGFRPTLMPATKAVRAEAREWIGKSFRTTGTSGRGWISGYPNGIEGVLRAAFAMDPEIDEIFIVSDADFQRTPPGGGGQDVPWAELRRLTKDLQSETIGGTRLRLLCYYPPPDGLAEIRAWVKENDGTLRVYGGNEPPQ